MLLLHPDGVKNEQAQGPHLVLVRQEGVAVVESRRHSQQRDGELIPIFLDVELHGGPPLPGGGVESDAAQAVKRGRLRTAAELTMT